MFTQLRERLERELNEVAPHTVKVKVVTPANAVERRFSVWIGALLRRSTRGGKREFQGQGRRPRHCRRALLLRLDRCTPRMCMSEERDLKGGK